MIDTLDAPAVASVDLEPRPAFAATTVQQNELKRIPAPGLDAAGDPVMRMLEAHMARGGDTEQMNKLLDLLDRMQAMAAVRAFNEDFAAFKAESVQIIKRNEIKDGPLRGKSYADLNTVVQAVTPALSMHKLSASWKLTKDEPDWIEVTCYLRHTLGHVETVYMGAPPDKGPGRNNIQARASSVSYLERYTFLAVCGLATGDQPDVDEHGGGFEDDARALMLRLIGEAESTATDAAALEVWKKNNAKLASWPWAHKQFKNAVTAHRDALKGGAQ